MLRMNNVTVEFNPESENRKTVLNGLCLDLKEGEFCCVIGSNGAGKSTLSRVIAGDVIPRSGRIFLGKRDVTDLKTRQLAYGVARVFQDPRLGTLPELSIEENLALAERRSARKWFGWAVNTSLRKKFRDIVCELDMGLEARMREPMGNLSGGQRQAVAILMATLTPADLLLLDEPTAALDPKIAGKINEISAALVRTKKMTTLMITHSLQEAKCYGDRVLLLKDGVIKKDFTSAEFGRLPDSELLSFYC